MIAAKNDFNRYNTDMNAYLDCIKQEIDATPKGSDQAVAGREEKGRAGTKSLVQKNNAAVDELQAVVGRFNEQLKIFKAKHK